MKAVDFELTLRPTHPHYDAVVRCTVTEPNYQETVIDTTGKPPMRVVIDKQQLLELALEADKYGRTLGQMLLAESQLARLISQARSVAQQAHVPLRLRLSLPPDLQPLRWETLRDPHHMDTPLLTTGEQVVCSRYLSSADWTAVGPRPLGERRALVLLATPPDLKDYNLEPLALGEQHALIAQSFGAMLTTVLDTGQARLDRLIEELRSGPDILLILAHGRVDNEGETWLYLESTDGHTDPVNGSVLAERIAELSVRPQLIILGVCESAGNGYGAALLALGPKLAEIGVPAVLAMQARITLETLRDFLPMCMSELDRDGRIDMAVAVARGEVRERPDFWVPVLFQRLASGRLWRMPDAEPETPEELLERMPTDRVPEDAPPLAPISRLHLLPNPQFIGREEELRQLAGQLKVGKTSVVTSKRSRAVNPAVITTGIGGVGKTQLAIELAHRYGGYFAGGVFWVSFADPATIADEVAACGQFMGLLLAGLNQEAQVHLTQAAWQQPIPRLLIFDNCEDETLLQEWLPKVGGCRVLVTSRRATWSTILKVQMLRLDVLPRADSVMLLQQLHADLTEAEAGKIAAALGDLPLALHLAGCYLARYRTPVDQYLDKLDKVRFIPHPSLRGRGIATMPTEREPNVEKVFALSFAQLDTNDAIDKLARQLLARAACFAPGELIRLNWLETTITPEGDEEEQGLARTDAIERLLGLGLLEPVAEGVVRLHRLLVAYAALALSDADALSAVEQVVGWLAKQANDTKVPQAMLPMLPHLRHLVQEATEREDELVGWLLNSLGSYLNTVGSYAEAFSLMERALVIYERVLGAEHPHTATTLNNLAGLYWAQGAYEAARPLMERALAIRERVLGTEHPDTATTLNNLAGLYRAQGAYEAARPLYERALVIYEQVLGSEHPDTATCLNNLAGLYRAQGAYEAARLLLEQALAIREQVLEADHPQTALSLNNLAELYRALGAYEAARPLMERALAIYERVLGTDHPDTAQSLNNLAGLYWAQGAYEAARPIMERALAIREQVLGAEHPDTAQSLNNLAELYQALGAYEAARPLYERALAIAEQVLGAEHPETATCLNNLAGLLGAQGAYEAARPLYERALAIAEQVLGTDHPDTAQSLNNLAGLLGAQGAYEAARPLMERALAIYERVLGTDHPNTAQSLNNLAGLHRALGAYEVARLLYERSLAIYERVLGVEHPDTATCLNNLAVLHAHEGQFALAHPLLERAIAIRQARLGPMHPDTVLAQQSLAAMRRATAIAALPEAMRAALHTHDDEALQQAIAAFPPEERQAMVAQLAQAMGVSDLLGQFTPLLQNIVAVALGDEGPRSQVEAALAQLEDAGYHLTAAVEAIWTGQRDLAALTEGLDDTDTALVQQVLALLPDVGESQ